jgi:hypothetical protein
MSGGTHSADASSNADRFRSPRQDDDVPPEILKNLKIWSRMGNLLRFTHVVLVLAGTAAALLVATFTGELAPIYVKSLTYIATLSIGTLTAFNIAGKADSTRRAWRHVSAAILKFRTDPSFTIAALIRAYEDAEVMIGDVPFNAPDRPPLTTGGMSFVGAQPAPHLSTKGREQDTSITQFPPTATRQ